MESLLGKYSPYIYAILRIFAGLLFAMHGSQKVLGIPPGNNPPASLFSLMGFGGALELIGGLMIAFGLFASYAAFITSGEMAVAYFMMHFPRGFFPIVNGGDLAVLYCFIFLYIAAQGSGVWSIDNIIAKGKLGSPALK